MKDSAIMPNIVSRCLQVPVAGVHLSGICATTAAGKLVSFSKVLVPLLQKESRMQADESQTSAGWNWVSFACVLCQRRYRIGELRHHSLDLFTCRRPA